MADLEKDIFAEFIEAKKNGTYKCPFCSSERFLINGTTDDLGPGIMQLNTGLEPSPAPATTVHNFYSFSCANCGHTDFFHSNQVTKWLSETGKK